MPHHQPATLAVQPAPARCQELSLRAFFFEHDTDNACSLSFGFMLIAGKHALHCADAHAACIIDGIEF